MNRKDNTFLNLKNLLTIHAGHILQIDRMIDDRNDLLEREKFADAAQLDECIRQKETLIALSWLEIREANALVMATIQATTAPLSYAA